MLESLYGAYRRAARADAHRLARPVISIGNISMGGRGKTPLAALVARLLIAAGERPSLLSRGYGRAIADPGVTVVSDGHATIGADGAEAPHLLSDLAHSGDEPLMLARAVPGAAVLVCAERALAGALGERALGCTVHVLDDGFQHHQLRRDVDIVLVTPEDLVAQPMPFGRLREPVGVLADADAVVVDGEMSPGVVSGKRLPVTFSLHRQLRLPVPVPMPAPVFAVAGIAQPERFFTALAGDGVAVAGTRGFADHFAYAPGDAAAIRSAAASAGAGAIVTTSKDVVRLEHLGPWPIPLVEIPLEVSVEPASDFRAWLLDRLAQARA